MCVDPRIGRNRSVHCQWISSGEIPDASKRKREGKIVVERAAKMKERKDQSF